MKPPGPGSAWWAVILLAVMAAVITAAWRTGTRRAARARSCQEAACDRDAPHDRVTLSRCERAAWVAFRAQFELEAEAEERARMKPGSGSETAP